MSGEPTTLIEAIRYFSDPQVCHDFMVEMRWPDGVTCPTCGRDDVRFIPTRRMWECRSKHPKRQFSVKVGTIFEGSPIGLDKWLAALWLIANSKNGVSSYEMARSLGVTQSMNLRFWEWDRVYNLVSIAVLLALAGSILIASIEIPVATDADGEPILNTIWDEFGFVGRSAAHGISSWPAG